MMLEQEPTRQPQGEGWVWGNYRVKGTRVWAWRRPALAAAARQGGDVQQAPAESPQSGPKGNAQKVQP